MRYTDLIGQALRAMRSRPLWLFSCIAGAAYLPAHGVTLVAVIRSLEASMAVLVGPPDVDSVIAMMEAMPGIALAALTAALLAIPAYTFFESGVSIFARARFAGRTPTLRDLLTATKSVYRRALTAHLVLYLPWMVFYTGCAVAVGFLAEEFIGGLIARGDVTGVIVWTVIFGVLAMVLVVAVFVAMLGGIFAVRAVVLDGSTPLAAVKWALGVIRRIGRSMAAMYAVVYLAQMVYSTLVSLLITPVLVVGTSAAVLLVSAREGVPGTQTPAAVTWALSVFIAPTYLLTAIAAVPMFAFAAAAWTAFYERLLGRLPLPGEAAAERGITRG